MLGGDKARTVTPCRDLERSDVGRWDAGRLGIVIHLTLISFYSHFATRVKGMFEAASHKSYPSLSTIHYSLSLSIILMDVVPET